MLLSGCSTTPVEVKNYKTECINGDCVNSKGTYTWLSGETYTGEFKDGKFLLLEKLQTNYDANLKNKKI